MPDEIGAHLLGRRADPGHPRAASLFAAADVLPTRSTRTFRYWYQGSAWLDQGNTGECVGHALAHRWADSPKTHAGIDHAWAEKLYLDATWIDAWNDNNGDINSGTSGLAACEVLRQRGLISEYRWITSVEDLVTAVLDIGPVAVGTVWFDSMFNPEPWVGNSYIRVDRHTDIAGGHEYLINGVNINPSEGGAFFRVKNSWGRTWGHSGTARILVSDLDYLIYGVGNDGDAVLINEVA